MQTFTRTEFKFLVRPDQLNDLAQNIARHLPLHTYGDGPAVATNGSLYFDSPQLHLYRHRVFSPELNALVRFRWYGERPAEHLFTELKLLQGRQLVKRRFELGLGEVGTFLGGAERANHTARNGRRSGRSAHGAILAGDGVSDDSAFRAALQGFIGQLGLMPRLRVAYRRLAFQRPDDQSTRITLDGDLVFVDPNDGRTSRFPFGILEVKVKGEYPNWLPALLDRPGVVACDGFSKYEQGCASVFDLRASGMPIPRWKQDGAAVLRGLGDERMSLEELCSLPRLEFNGHPLAGGMRNRPLKPGEPLGCIATDGCGLDLQALLGRS